MSEFKINHPPFFPVNFSVFEVARKKKYIYMSKEIIRLSIDY